MRIARAPACAADERGALWALREIIAQVRGEPRRGGTFAAWEQPAILVEELRTAFASLR